MSMRNDLLCRNGCGFFGNPEWQWFCSKCWREHLQRGRSVQQAAAPPLASIASGDHTKGGLPFHPFGAGSSSPLTKAPGKRDSPKRTQSNAETLKHKRQVLDHNLKQIFQKGKFGNKDSPEKLKPKKVPKSATHSVPPEARAVSLEFADFLKARLESAAVSDISLQVKTMQDKIHSFFNSKEQQEIEDLSSMLQEFYQAFQKRLETKQHFHALSDEDITKVMNYAEKYLLLSCYKVLFCPVISNDEEKDLEIQNRIRSLNWISTKDLHCTINESSQEVRDLLFEAINDILEMDGQMSPQDKMECLVKCSKKIFEMLQLSNEHPASADDFLPCLIYVCLKANPPRIQSNLNFITRFCNENKLRMGEAGYFFANLCCAMSFIENMTAQSVNMDPEEFESYVSGKAVPPGSWRTSLLMCEGLQQMSQNLKSLGDLKTRHDKVLSEAIKLQEEMTSFQLDVESEVKEILERTAYQIKKASKESKPIQPDADLEADAGAKEALPAPLMPQNLSSSAPVKVQDGSKQGNLLEDYLSMNSACASDDVSLVSFDSSVTKQPQIDISSSERHDVQEDCQSNIVPSQASTYRGFTAQSNQITSISCDNSLPLETPSSSEEGGTFFPSSSSEAPQSSETCEASSVDANHSEEESVVQKSDSSSTPSSSPLVSAATSLSTPTDELGEPNVEVVE